LNDIVCDEFVNSGLSTKTEKYNTFALRCKTNWKWFV